MVITPETRRTISSFRHIATSPLRRPLSRALAWDGHVVGLGGKGRDRANVGGTWGWNTRHPIKVPHRAEK